MNDYYTKYIDIFNYWKPWIQEHYDQAIQVIDMFSGAGGMSLGFAALSKALKAFELVGAIDINEVSLKTYNQNFGVPTLNVSVSEIANNVENIDLYLKKFPRYDKNRPTVLIGCAPCQGFTAHRKKNWDIPDKRNGLIEAFADVAVAINPDCIVMENVPELLSGRYWSHFEYFSSLLKSSGYIVKQAIHNAAEHGVPQERFRAIIVAMKKDFMFPNSRLSRANFKTVRDAISDLEIIESGEASLNDPLHKAISHKTSTLDVIKAVPKDGGSIPKGIGPISVQTFKGFADVYGRLSWRKPSITITHYARNPASGRFTHPELNRGLTIREVARLQSFPDGFVFSGSTDDIYRQIGEAVPPLLSFSIAATMLSNFLNETNNLQSENLILNPVPDSYVSEIVKEKKSGIVCV